MAADRAPTRRGALAFLRALIATNQRAARAKRGAFWMQVVFMVGNNSIFWTVWILFFERFESIGGWRLRELSALFGIVAIAHGIGVILAGGVRSLARKIAEGELDALLAQPRDPLVYAIGSETMPSGWGDVASGLFLVTLAAPASAGAWAAVAVGALAGAVIVVATAVLFQSLAFWAGPVDGFARQAWDVVITFSVYPQTIYAGAIRVLLFTVIPAGFIGYLPVEAMRDPRASTLLAIVAAALAYATLARLVFRAGLRRYASGSRMHAGI